MSVIAPPRDLQLGGEPPQPATGGSLTKVVTFLAVALAAGAAAASGLSVGHGSKLAVVLPLAATAGIGLGLLALTRFRVYVMLMLVLRSGLDLAKLSGAAAGNTVTNTAGTRALDPASILAVLFLLAAALWLAAQHRQQGRLPGSASVSASSSSVSSSSSGSAAVSTSSSTSSATKSNSQSLSAAIGTITGLGGGSITVGPVSCQLGAGSPDTSGFRIGGRVSLVCVNGTVTGLAPAS